MESQAPSWTAKATAIEHSPSIAAICGALALAQGEIRNAERDAENPYFESTYSSLAAVWDAIRGPMTKNGLSVLQGQQVRLNADLAAGEVDVTTMVLHTSGEWFRTTITLPVVPMARRKKKREGEDSDNDIDRTPGKITPQAVGSAITYGRRYGLESMAGTAPEAEDDDGNGASGKADRAVIPATGSFEDVIEDVTFETKKKRDGQGTFVVSKVITGKHGPLECWEEVGQAAKAFAGTAQVMAFRAEKGKYGWKLIEFKPVEAEPAPEIDPLTNEPFPPGVQKARRYIAKELETRTTLAAIDELVALVAKSGTAYQSPKVTCLIDEARAKLGMPAAGVLHEAVAQ